MRKQCLLFAQKCNCKSARQMFKNDLFNLNQGYGQV